MQDPAHETLIAQVFTPSRTGTTINQDIQVSSLYTTYIHTKLRHV